MPSRQAPRVRRVNQLSEYRSPEGTGAFFRALSEADEFIDRLDNVRELTCRCEELEAQWSHTVEALKEIHSPLVANVFDHGSSATSTTTVCIACMDLWPCPTMKLIQED